MKRFALAIILAVALLAAVAATRAGDSSTTEAVVSQDDLVGLDESADAKPDERPSVVEVIEKQGRVYIPGPDTDPHDIENTAIGYIIPNEQYDPETKDMKPFVSVYDVKTGEVVGVDALNIGFVPNDRLDDPGFDIYAEIERATAEGAKTHQGLPGSD